MFFQVKALFLAFLFPIFLFAQSYYDVEYDKIEDNRFLCIDKSQAYACVPLFELYVSEKKYLDAFEAIKKSCELKESFGCFNLYRYGNEYPEEFQEIIFSTMKSACDAKAELCEALALFYKAKKDYSSAIVYAKKYFEVNKFGSYPVLQYEHGNKEEAYKVSENACKADQRTCSQFVRLFPDHPKLDFFLDVMKSDCLKSEDSFLGLSTCSTVGVYFEKQKRYKDAFEVWNTECGRNGKISCLLIAGNKNTSIEQRQIAFKKFCKGQWEVQIDYEDVFKKRYCEKRETFQEIPVEMIKDVEKLFNMHLRTKDINVSPF